MSQRTHNIYFHLHTVTGIVISVGLYIIFFAGAFTLFTSPVSHWEKTKGASDAAKNSSTQLDLNRVMDSVGSAKIDLYRRSIYINATDLNNISVYVAELEDSLANGKANESVQLELNASDYTLSTQQGQNFQLATLLYDLHFFYQLGDFGYFVSGLVSLFFLFAIVTGIIVHWKKIKMNFFVFRPKQKLKTVWTDAHTALGVIGIPFQFMYALTGSIFGLGIVLVLAGTLHADGDREKFYKMAYGEHEEIKAGERTDIAGFDYNHYKEKAEQRWPGFKAQYYSIENAASSTQQFSVGGYTDSPKRFIDDGEVVYEMQTGRLVHEHDPYKKEYSDYVYGPLHRLHFGEFGGMSTVGVYAVKAAYFVMALLTCFVIITGVLIWLEARNKNNVPEKKRRFNKSVGNIYLAVCLTMFPVTACAFIVSKLLPVTAEREAILNWTYFGG